MTRSTSLRVILSFDFAQGDSKDGERSRTKRLKGIEG